MIPEFLWHGAEAYGFRGSAWTCGRVAKVIEQEFGVAYDKGHVSRLLKQLRWTLARQESLNGSHSVEFPVHLMRAADEGLLETLPGYAPDLNPWDEGGWNHLKNTEMRNLACKDLEELHEQFHLAAHRLRLKAWLVHSFFNQAGLQL